MQIFKSKNYPKNEAAPTTNIQTPEDITSPLWKRVHIGVSKLQENSTLKTSQKGIKGENQDAGDGSTGNLLKKSNINVFLHQSHHKICESVYDSESQVIQKLSLNWQENSHSFACQNPEKITICGLKHLNFRTPRSNKSICFGSFQWSQLESLQQLLNYLKEISPKIYKQLQALLNEKELLGQECMSMRQKIEKSQEKIKKLTQDITSVTQDFIKLREQVETRIQIQEEKYKIQYEKAIEKVKEEYQKKLAEGQKKIEISTTLTNSLNLNELGQTMGKIQSDKFRLRTDSMNTSIGKRRGQLMRSNPRLLISERNRDKYPASARLQNKMATGSGGKNISKEYQQIVYQIIKPGLTKSLLLDSSNE